MYSLSMYNLYMEIIELPIYSKNDSITKFIGPHRLSRSQQPKSDPGFQTALNGMWHNTFQSIDY